MSSPQALLPVTKAIFPVGGLGTRFLPATKSLPKEMLPVVDRPIIQYAYDEAAAAGIEDFVFVTGRNKNAITNHFDHSYELERILDEKNKQRELDLTKGWLPPAGHIYFTRQMAPLGLGHAIWCARAVVKDREAFAVLLADDMVLTDGPNCLEQMLAVYRTLEGPANLIAVEEVPMERTNQYGILDVESDEGGVVKARGLVEKPKPEDAPSNLAIIGRYILQPGIFDYLDRQEPGSGGEIQITDAIAAMMDTTPVYGVRFSGRRYDCGNRLGFLEANVAFALSREDLRGPVAEMLRKHAS